MRASAWVRNERRSMSSHSSVAKKLSAMALSKQSPADPVDGTTPISRHRLPKASEVYCDPLVGVMYDPLGAALSQRHVQRPEHQFGAKMVGHGPSHHPAAEHVEHDGQVHEPRPGRHVGHVGHPKPIRRIGLELAFDPVRDHTMALVHARSAHASASAHPGQPCLAHQTSHPFAAHPAAAGHQLGMDPRRPVGATRCLVDGPYRAPQRLVALRTRTTPTASPRVVSAGGDTQPTAHRGHPMAGLIRLHELEDFARTEPVSRANQAVAFASISRSSRS